MTAGMGTPGLPLPRPEDPSMWPASASSTRRASLPSLPSPSHRFPEQASVELPNIPDMVPSSDESGAVELVIALWLLLFPLCRTDVTSVSAGCLEPSCILTLDILRRYR